MFQSLSRDSGRLNKFPPRRAASQTRWFQSLSRDSGRLNHTGGCFPIRAESPFQSLSRDSGRLNYQAVAELDKAGYVSIPQSGFGAFERLQLRKVTLFKIVVSIPQSGFGAFELPPDVKLEVRSNTVSIPQSGFGAFELGDGIRISGNRAQFQSLSRDSGRLNNIYRIHFRQ